MTANDLFSQLVSVCQEHGTTNDHTLELLNSAVHTIQFDALPCIRHRVVGAAEDVTFEEFAERVVQDWGEAERIAREMLEDLDKPYGVYADEPNLYQEYEITDAAELERQLG